LTPLNLLQHDNSSLSTDQWTLLSNLVHSYDGHNALPIANNFMKEINSLHPKLRLKIDLNKFDGIITSIYQSIEPFIQSNQDFKSIPIEDRSIVMRGAIDNVTCISGSYILRQSELINNAGFCNALETSYGSIPFNFTVKLNTLLDGNVNIVKLTLSIFAFCASSCTLFDQNSSVTYLKDNKSLLRVQNMYAELIWKYLLYTHSFEQAVKRFSCLVQCLIVGFTLRTHLQAVKNHTETVDSIVQKFEQQKINISDA
jgi:hypothetical protein